MRKSRVLVRVLTALGVAAGMAVVAAPAAQAVTYANLSCESGGGKFYCLLEHDGVAPVTIRWTVNGSYSSGLDDRVFTGQRNCGRSPVSVTATVTDATGAVTGTASFPCNYGPWP